MNCEFCGEEVSQGALACPRCGSPVSPSAAQEKPHTPPPPKVSPDGPAVEKAPHPPTPQTEQAEEADAGWVVPGMPRAVQPTDTRPWEIQAPPEAPPQIPAPPPLEQAPDYEAPPEAPPQIPAPPPLEQAPDYEAPPVPLAKQEEDFIALAEEKAQMEKLAEQPPDPDSEIPGAEHAPAPEASIIESALAGGPETETAVDSDLTGGHKGGGFMAASVAGAGVQTADDPFGLNVTETAPPLAEEEATGRQFNWAKWRNILIMIVAFLVAVSVAAIGLYFGFLRKDNAPTTDPVQTLNNFLTQIVSGDMTKLNDVSVPGSSFQKELSSMLEPYAKTGVLTIKDFQADATKETDANVTVEIKKFVVKLLTTAGETEYLDVLSVNTPVPLRKTVSLVKQNGKWLVSD
jgi:flagellar basal body-associated protein FliL